MCSSAWERKDEQCHWFRFTYIVFLFGLQSIYRWPEAGCWSEASSTAEWDRQCYTGHVLRQGRRGHQKPGRPGGGQVLGKVKVRHVKCSIHSFYEDLVHSLCENSNFFLQISPKCSVALTQCVEKVWFFYLPCIDGYYVKF